MKRILVVATLAVTGLLGQPTRAAADVTFFVGFSPTPHTRFTRGVAAGVNMMIVGFEFDYANTSADEATGSPRLQTGMMNVLVMTPTKHSVYATIGGGVFRESLDSLSETSFGTNLGGGVKFTVLGPLHVRFDYRVFMLRGTPRYNRVQRFYAGVNIPF